MSQPTKLELCMFTLIDLFKSYSSKQGDPKNLSKAEVKEMMEKEFPGFLSSCKDPKAVDEFMKGLDMDNDGQLNFLEFATMIVTLTAICQEMVAQ